MSKKAFAIKWTVEEWESVYFWTFTFKNAVGSDDIAGVWRSLTRRMKKTFGRSWCGLRVFEVHPGGHGVHVHCLVPNYIPAKVVWAVVGDDFGRPDVRRLPNARAISYATKYLRKSQFADWENKLPKGSRVWAWFGSPPFKTTCNSITVHSAVGTTYRWLESHGWRTEKLLGILDPGTPWRRMNMVKRLLASPERWVESMRPILSELLELIPTASRLISEATLNEVHLFDGQLMLRVPAFEAGKIRASSRGNLSLDGEEVLQDCEEPRNTVAAGNPF